MFMGMSLRRFLLSMQRAIVQRFHEAGWHALKLEAMSATARCPLGSVDGPFRGGKRKGHGILLIIVVVAGYHIDQSKGRARDRERAL
ncbi:hypothetical protein CXF92_14640 [Pseudomonas sp. Choline-3u-10]|nr:hypothetical protein RT21_01950 [Pseudomonas sp. 10B238]MAL36142.1 hypothetical protein [Pseudomonas sp.]PKG92406.1 hypothetical protein CXF92_14640 [Pseudomonas sp. Choline-3u-10]HBM10832.1 hypothetical protein [Pseudomonas sp.]